MRLLKQDVINKLAEKTGLYKKDVRAVLDSFHELVYEELDADSSLLGCVIYVAPILDLLI